MANPLSNQDVSGKNYVDKSAITTAGGVLYGVIVTHRLVRPRVGLACPADLASSVTVIRVHLQSSRGCTGLGLSV